MPRLLIVDDEPKNLEQYRNIATVAGFSADEIVVAGSEADADRLIDATAFEVALIDLYLSETRNAEGVELIGRLHDAQPSCFIIALTRDEEKSKGIRAIKAGADDFIWSKWKHISFDQLLQERLTLWKEVVEV